MTRYPKKGKGSKWTALELKNVPPAWKGDKLSEERLQGEVRVTAQGEVSVRWLTPYKWDGKLCWFYCGTTPTATLDDVREQREWCSSQVAGGVNPGDRKKLDKVEAQAAVTAALAAAEVARENDTSFNEMYLKWLEVGVARQDGNAELRREFEKDVLPAIGKLPVRLVGEEQLRGVIKAVVDRGSPRMGVILFNNLVQLYAWAEARKPWRGLLNAGQEGNPMILVEVKPLLPKDYDMDNVCERVLSEDEIRRLWNTLEAQRSDYAKAPNKRTARQPLERSSELSIWICLSTLCRIGELQMAEWSHVDRTARTWFIPKENVKSTRGKKQDLLVSLSDFAFECFEELRKLSWDSRFVFPSINDRTKHRDVKTVTKQVYDRQLAFHPEGKRVKGRSRDNSLVIGDEQWTPHDLRRTGATMMQALGIPESIIDRCQNHVMEGSKVRRHYLQHPYAAEKAEAWQKLGLRLSALVGRAAPLRLAA